MGGVDKVKRQHDQGRLTVRERIDGLIDKNSFHEIGAISGIAEYDENSELKHLTPANCVFGRGKIDGRTVVVVGDDFTVRGGSADASISAKPLMAEEMAHDFRLPIIRVIEGSGGGGSVKTIETRGAANLPGGVGGTRWYWFTIANMARVPVVALGLGSVAGLGAARLAASHYSVMTRNSAMFVAGPPVVKRLGQDLTKQELGGAEIQTRAGGVDDAVDTEEEAFERARRFLSYLPSSVYDLPPTTPCTDDPERAEEFAVEGGAAQSPPGLQDAPDHRRRRRQGLVLRGQRQFRPPGHHRACPARRPRGAAAGQRSLPLWRVVDGGGVPEGGALGRFRRDLPSAGGLSDGLSGLHDRARGREVGDHPSRRARDGGGQPEHGALVHHHRTQRFRRGRRRASAGQPLFDALCLAVGLLGLAAAGRRHRGGLPRRHRRIR